MKFFLSFATFFTLAAHADLNGSYLVHKTSCFPNYGGEVQPIVMTVTADAAQVGFSIKMNSEFSDVGVYDFPIDTLFVGDRHSGSGLAYLRNRGVYTSGGNKFSYTEYDNTGIVANTTFSLSASGSLTIKRRLDNGFAGTCTASKIQ